MGISSAIGILRLEIDVWCFSFILFKSRSISLNFLEIYFREFPGICELVLELKSIITNP